VRFCRHIPLFCAVLIFFAVQCRAQCVVIPHAATQQAPECPLHKSKAPAESKCSHAPQWDLDDARQIIADLPEAAQQISLTESLPAFVEQNPKAAFRPQVPFSLRL
jgi:hypothetical protein